MPKFALTADIHIDHGRHGRLNPVTGRDTAWESTDACWLTACDIAIEQEVDGFIVLGDMFLHGKPSPEAQELIADGLRRVSQANIPVLVFNGNHEFKGVRSGHRTVVDRFGDINGVTVVGSNAEIVQMGGIQIGVMPWPRIAEMRSLLDLGTSDPQAANELIAAEVANNIESLAYELDDTVPSLLAGHLTLDEASVDTGRRGSEMGLAHLFNEPVIPVSAIEDGPWGYGALGHIHLHQSIGERCEYVGSADRIDFSDEKVPKALTVIEYGSDGTVTTSREPLPARTLFTINVKEDEELPEIPEGAIVRVRLETKNTDIEKAARKAVVDAGGHVSTIEVIAQKRKSSEGPVTVEAEIPVMDGLARYLEKMGIEGDRRKALLNAAEPLIKENN